MLRQLANEQMLYGFVDMRRGSRACVDSRCAIFKSTVLSFLQWLKSVQWAVCPAPGIYCLILEGVPVSELANKYPLLDVQHDEGQPIQKV